MKKYTAVIGVIIICLSAMSGCIKRSLPELPGDAAAFEMGTFMTTLPLARSSTMAGLISCMGRPITGTGRAASRL